MVRKPSRGRQKIPMKKIENTEARHVCFSKRRTGLFKKASELCILTGAEVAIIVFSPGGKPFSFGHPSLDSVIRSFLVEINGDNPSAAFMNMSEADRHDPVVEELSRQYTELLGMVNELKKKNEEREAEAKAGPVESHHLWKREIEDLQLAELKQFYDALQDLKKKATSRCELLNMNDMTFTEMLTGASSSKSLPQLHQMGLPQEMAYNPQFYYNGGYGPSETIHK